MNHAEKVRHFIDQALHEGVSPWSAAPPLWRLFWKLGWELPPPAFLGFWFNALLFGAFFAGLAGLLAWPFQTGGVDPLRYVLSWAAGGVLFGLLMAAIVRTRAGRLALPAWRHYPDA